MVPNGCESQYLRDELFGPGASFYGVDIEYVGSGREGLPEDAPVGTKRFAPGQALYEDYGLGDEITILGLQPDQEAGENAAAIAVRPGDSGGVQAFALANGSRRVIGIPVHIDRSKPNLGDGLNEVFRKVTRSTPAPRYLKWLEDASGHDITPCHSWAGGKWNWSGPASCGSSFDTSPETGGSSWPGCTSTTNSTTTECSGWFPSGPDTETAPSEADVLLDFAANGDVSPTSWMFGKNKLAQWTGTIAADSLTSTTRDANEVFGGRGNDALFVGSGADEVHGGVGNDLIYGGAEPDVIVPGRGLDLVYGEGGNDKIIIAGACELVSGEVINGGNGTDTLYSPLTSAGLASLGVTVTSIESIVINHAALEQEACAGDGTLGPAFE